MGVEVMPWFSPEYSSYYWPGLVEVFGEQHVRISADAFDLDARDLDWRDTFCFMVDGRRFWISSNDHAEVRPEPLAWADVAGVVNMDAPHDGAIPLGPSFGVRSWEPMAALRLAARFVRAPKPRTTAWRALPATLRRQSRRQPVSAYVASPPAPDDAPIAYVGSWWGRHPEANLDRQAFVVAAAATGRFVGGFVGSAGTTLPPEVAGHATAPVAHPDYLALVRRSLVVFNHPAVHGCLGWKLGEFLALGKAIITTPVDRLLPAPLEHGEHWHVVTDPAEIPDALGRLAADGAYRARLETGARRYWEEHLAPAAMVRRMLAA